MAESPDDACLNGCQQYGYLCIAETPDDGYLDGSQQYVYLSMAEQLDDGCLDGSQQYRYLCMAVSGSHHHHSHVSILSNAFHACTGLYARRDFAEAASSISTIYLICRTGFQSTIMHAFVGQFFYQNQAATLHRATVSLSLFGLHSSQKTWP